MHLQNTDIRIKDVENDTILMNEMLTEETQNDTAQIDPIDEDLTKVDQSDIAQTDDNLTTDVLIDLTQINNPMIGHMLTEETLDTTVQEDGRLTKQDHRTTVTTIHGLIEETLIDERQNAMIQKDGRHIDRSLTEEIPKATEVIVRNLQDDTMRRGTVQRDPIAIEMTPDDLVQITIVVNDDIQNVMTRTKDLQTVHGLRATTQKARDQRKGKRKRDVSPMAKRTPIAPLMVHQAVIKNGQALAQNEERLKDLLAAVCSEPVQKAIKKPCEVPTRSTGFFNSKKEV